MILALLFMLLCPLPPRPPLTLIEMNKQVSRTHEQLHWSIALSGCAVLHVRAAVLIQPTHSHLCAMCPALAVANATLLGAKLT